MLEILFSWKVILLSVWFASAMYVHFRGEVRLKLTRQLTDHSTFTARYNSLVYLFSGVPLVPVLDVDAVLFAGQPVSGQVRQESVARTTR